MSATIKELVARRKQIRASLTRFKNYIDTHTTSEYFSGIKLRIASLKNSLEEIEKIQLQLEILEANDNWDYDVFEDEFYNAISIAESRMSEKVSIPEINVGHESQNYKHIVPLPTITIPKFSGKYDDWIPFHDTFKSLVHDNSTLSNIQKLHYLKSSVEGEAARTIQYLDVSDANYEAAWHTLMTRFKNERLIVQKHVEAILDLPHVQKNSASSTRVIVDSVTDHLKALTSLGQNTKEWGTILLHIIARKLDFHARQAWEATLTDTKVPKFQQLIDFLTQRCQVYEAMSVVRPDVNSPIKTRSTNKTLSFSVTQHKPNCAVCKDVHFLYQCGKFLNMSIDDRIRVVKTNNLCRNCLRTGHRADRCRISNCKHCNKKHNTLLHVSQQPEPTISDQSKPNQIHIDTEAHTSTSKSTSFISRWSSEERICSQVILATALVKVEDADGKIKEIRALLDPGSQSCYITEKCARQLKLKTSAISVSVTGVNSSVSHISQATKVKIASRYDSFVTRLNCLLIPTITDKLPLRSFDKNSIILPEHINLADPEFAISREIDLLIGADVYFDILLGNKIKTAATQPYIVETKLGWIICGSVIGKSHHDHNQVSANLITLNDLNRTLENFWKIEECSNKKVITQDDADCEEHFQRTTRRNQHGRFMVELPFKDDPALLGESRSQSLKRWYNLERKLERQPELKCQYTQFMKEYEELGHMQQVTDEVPNVPHFYVPHHSVLKSSNLTTKLRVVFDGSAKTTTGVSLNDLLHTGPQIQQDLFSILARFRTYEYVITADVTKMYRQVLMADKDVLFQRILWREHMHEPVKTFRLNTVTYGTRAGPYLAIRCMQELAQREGDKYPQARDIVMRDFYVDDLITGANTVDEVLKMKEQVSSLLELGGFNLRKWCSNSAEVFGNISEIQDEMYMLNWDKNETIKTLGIQWNAKDDNIQYRVTSQEREANPTKRSILSCIAQTFDPLGLVGPCIVNMKILMQRIWQEGISWDDALPPNICESWQRYVLDLYKLNDIKIPRKVISSDTVEITLHGFCDASEKAYGACIYICSENSAGQRAISLLCAKSKVAPLKSTTIPRLELCGAVLLAKLMKNAVSVTHLNFKRCICWTDSTITLTWIMSSSKSWKTFVANRVAQIQELTNDDEWRHVQSRDNPADIISRGVTPAELANSRLWWNGPQWLQQPTATWPDFKLSSNNDAPEKREIVLTISNRNLQTKILSFERYSKLSKLKRVVAYCFRFMRNCKSVPQNRNYTSLNTDEISLATTRIIQLVQRTAFAEEIKIIQEGKSIVKGHLVSLSPFLDEYGILRVGGRLKHSELEYNHRHQILLPQNHQVTNLIAEEAHVRSCHAGPHGTLAMMRNEYWVPAARNLTRKIVRECVRCFKVHPKPLQPYMASLPASRVTPARPFSTSGVDFCGPIGIKETTRRNARRIKIYVAVFVCFATRAVHIELVGDLSAQSFIAALKRFLGRRGNVAQMHSDNATNFHGASNELKEFYKRCQFNENNEIREFLSKQLIKWNFIPPRTPHFGGLWEATVRATKRHLYRTIGSTLLTYEELNTLLIQIEAVLNSRPLTPLSSDPNDLTFLTPGHFLIGDSLTAPIEPSLSELPINRLSRWQHIEKMKQHFWSRWSREYLNQLQQRTKWTSPGGEPRVGQLVLIREDNLPPLCWATGKIEALHPGSDGIARVASVRTTKGVFKRGVARLCVFPIECN